MQGVFNYTNLFNTKDYGKTSFYFRGTNLYYNEKTKTYSLKPIIKKNIKFFGSESQINPYSLKLKNHYILETLRKITHYEHFISFLTLTTKEDYQHLEDIFSNIVKEFNKNFTLDGYKSKNKSFVTKNNLKDTDILEIINKKIHNYLVKDVSLWIKKEIRLNSVLTVASSKKIFNFLKRSPKFQREFKDKYIKQIDTEYNKQLTNNYETQYKNNFDNYYNCLKFRFNFNRNTQDYFRVLEFTKDKKPHFHILLNYYIPSSFIEKYLKTDATIYDNSFLLDQYFNFGSNKFTYKDCNSLLDKYNKFKVICKDNEVLRDVSTASINYVIKYLIKEPEKTKELMQQLHLKNKQIAVFNKNLLERYSHLDSADKLTKIGELNKLINLPCDNLEPSTFDIDLLDHKSKSSIDLDIQKEITKNLESKDIFLKTPQNKIIKNIESRYFKQFKITDLHPSLTYVKDEHFYKYNLLHCLERLNSLKYVTGVTLKPDSNILNLFSEDQGKQDFYKSFRNNYFNLLLGGAGAGKSFTLANLNKYTNKDTQVLYLTYKKVAKNRLVQDLQKKFKNNFICDNIDNFLSKRGEELNYVNSSNCYSPNKKIIVVVDEIGNVTYKQLYDVLSGLDLEKVCKFVFAGDFGQENPIKDISGSNSLIPELESLNFIHTTYLTQNFRTKEAPELVQEYNSLLHHNKLTSFELLDYYSNEDKVYGVICNKSNHFNKELRIITNSKRLRTFINNLILERNPNIKKKWIADKNHLEYKIVNGTEYIEEGESGEFKILRDIETQASIKLPKYLFSHYFILGFATTVTKVQGAGYNNILVMFDNYSDKLLTHNKLYTAITRAKFTCSVYFDSYQSYKTCIENKVINSDLLSFSNIKTVEGIQKQIINISEKRKSL